MNFTEWKESLCDPLYETDENPKCPPGYKWNKKQMMCVPKTEKDDVSKTNSKDRHPANGPGYHTIGSHGMNGAPYAYEEPATADSVSEAHDYDKEDDDEKIQNKNSRSRNRGNSNNTIQRRTNDS